MTDSSKDTPSSAQPLMSPEPAMVALKHPASNALALVMTGIYFLAIFVSLPLLGMMFLLTMPLGVRIENPRRALHLWVMGLVASAVFVIHARGRIALMGGLDAAWASSPVLATAWVGGAVLAIGVIIWHLTWVDSALAQHRRR